MKKIITACCILLLLCACVSAQAAKEPEYTLSKKNNTVLQNIPDRNIAVAYEPAVYVMIPGESPITGLPWEGKYLPVLVQIGNDVGNGEANRYDVRSAGIGNRTPWGLQYADILYEEMLGCGGYTRLTALFSDCFASGEPAAGVGPVRSCRIGPMLLREAWQGVLVYGGGMVGSYPMTDERMAWLYTESDALDWGLLVNFRSGILSQIGHAVRNVKSPNNFNIDIIKVRNGISPAYTAQTHPFQFQNGGAYEIGYQAAVVVNLDWGNKYNISHFVYDEEQGAYSRYCGVGINPKKWVLYTAYPTAEDREEEDRIPFTFANIIVQRMDYTYEGSKGSTAQSIGSGNADIFINGRYIPGYWVCAAIGDPTTYYDDQGNELLFNRGKTFITLFPNEARLTFTSGE